MLLLFINVCAIAFLSGRFGPRGDQEWGVPCGPTPGEVRQKGCLFRQQQLAKAIDWWPTQLFGVLRLVL